MHFPLFVGVLCLSLICYALLCVHSGSAIVPIFHESSSIQMAESLNRLKVLELFVIPSYDKNANTMTYFYDHVFLVDWLIAIT